MRQLMIAILIFVPATVFSQVTGVVMDKSSGYPVQNAYIRVDNGKTWTLSGIYGKFALKEDVIGKTLIISAIGFTNEQITASKEFMIIDLKTKVYQMPDVFVTAEKGKTDSLKIRFKIEP